MAIGGAKGIGISYYGNQSTVPEQEIVTVIHPSG